MRHLSHTRLVPSGYGDPPVVTLSLSIGSTTSSEAADSKVTSVQIWVTNRQIYLFLLADFRNTWMAWCLGHIQLFDNTEVFVSFLFFFCLLLPGEKEVIFVEIRDTPRFGPGVHSVHVLKLLNLKRSTVE